jgi:menaquinone-dependent protoporphyrinogen oxidase
MNNRILITYATRAGSTVEVSQAIAETLVQRGYLVDVIPIKENPQLDGYHAVVIGSAIRMGNWLPEAVKFVQENQQALKQVPVAFYTVHMLNTGEDEASRNARQDYLNQVRPLLIPAAEAFFAGKMDFSRLSFVDRLIAKMVKAVESDGRDWEEIRSWSQTVFDKNNSISK